MWSVPCYMMLAAGWYFLICWSLFPSDCVYWSCYELNVWVCNIGIMLHQMGWNRVLAFSWYFNSTVLATVRVQLVLLGVNLCWELSSYSHSKPTSLSAYKLVLKLPPALDERTCRMIISRMGNIRQTGMYNSYRNNASTAVVDKCRVRPYLNQQG